MRSRGHLSRLRLRTAAGMQIQLRKLHLAVVASVAFVLFLLYRWRMPSHPMIGRSALDPELISLLRDSMLHMPSQLPYALKEPEVLDPSIGQAQQILEILGNKTDGTFIECGALDGETRSNTLYMERVLGWRGLLIEPDPSNYKLMLDKHRHAWTVRACLSGETVSQVKFKQDFNMGKIDDGKPAKRPGAHAEYVQALCVPLEALLLALRWRTVDYFSLDVEGHEYAVLAALPFERLDIKTLSVEFRHVPEGKAAIRKLMESKGYEVYTEVTHHDDLANDFIFRRRS